MLETIRKRLDKIISLENEIREIRKLCTHSNSKVDIHFSTWHKEDNGFWWENKTCNDCGMSYTITGYEKIEENLSGSEA